VEYAVFEVRRTSIVGDQAFLFQTTVQVDVRALILDDETPELVDRSLEAVHEKPKPAECELRLVRDLEPSGLERGVIARESQENRSPVVSNVHVGAPSTYRPVELAHDEAHPVVRVQRVGLNDLHDVAGPVVPLGECIRSELADEAVRLRGSGKHHVTASEVASSDLGCGEPGDVAASRERFQVLGAYVVPVHDKQLSPMTSGRLDRRKKENCK